jgi:hypothetical protein
MKRARGRPSRVSALVALALAASLGAAAEPSRPDTGGAPGARPAAPDSSAHNLVVVEFRESPSSGLEVAGGFLGVPDSSGRFPASYRRFDPVTGQNAPPGTTFGNLLAFTDLGPGTYRVALILLEQSPTFRRLFPKEASQLTGDRCLVYADTLPALTFLTGDGDIRYLGRITRNTRPALGTTEMWEVSLEWSPGDERKAWKTLLKRRDLTPWRDLMERRLAALDSTAAGAKGRR